MGIIVRATVEDDWEQVRDLRLEMLADTPLAYLEALEDARGHDEQHWRQWARSGSDAPTATTLVAVDETTGRWVGTMRGFLAADRRLWLVGVYVAAPWRGRDAGVADFLLDAIEAWARPLGVQLFLEVHADNPRARAFYERRGFVLTGRSIPYPLNPAERELEMMKRLG